MSYVKNYLEMDKIDRLLDAMEHPERYSTQEIDAMLSDPETKETFDLLDKTKSSLQTLPAPDVNAEWERFERSRRHAPKQRPLRLLSLISRNIAASIAIGIASLTAVAAIVSVGIYHMESERSGSDLLVSKTAATDVAVAREDTITPLDAGSTAAAEIIVFDDETLESMMHCIAAYYGYSMVFGADAPRSLRLHYRWNQDLPVEDVVESLNNFEQITITIKGKTIEID